MKKTHEKDPARYAPGDMPKASRDKLNQIAKNKVPSADDLRLALDEAKRRERTQQFFRDQGAFPEGKEDSLSATSAIIQPAIDRALVSYAGSQRGRKEGGDNAARGRTKNIDPAFRVKLRRRIAEYDILYGRRATVRKLRENFPAEYGYLSERQFRRYVQAERK